MTTMSDDERDMYSDNDEDYDDMGDVGVDGDGTNRRAHHNALERKRRDQIKEQFTLLKEVIPELKGTKASRADILKKSTEHLKELDRTMARKQHAMAENDRKIKLLRAEFERQQRRNVGHHGRGPQQYDTSSSSSDSSESDLEPINSQRKRPNEQSWEQ